MMSLIQISAYFIILNISKYYTLSVVCRKTLTAITTYIKTCINLYRVCGIEYTFLFLYERFFYYVLRLLSFSQLYSG